METKFTKGPWFTEYRENQSGMYNQDVFDANGKTICECSWYEAETTIEIDGEVRRAIGTNREANAHLIAAAPEMYATLERVISNYQTVASLVEQQGYETSYSKDVAIIDALLAKARGEQ